MGPCEPRFPLSLCLCYWHTVLVLKMGAVNYEVYGATIFTYPHFHNLHYSGAPCLDTPHFISIHTYTFIYDAYCTKPQAQ